LKPTESKPQESADIWKERPTIEKTLVGFTLEQVHEEYQKSPNLFMHIQMLDKHIDYLEANTPLSEEDESTVHDIMVKWIRDSKGRTIKDVLDEGGFIIVKKER